MLPASFLTYWLIDVVIIIRHITNTVDMAAFNKLQKGEKQVRKYRGADKSLARPGTKQATATEDFEFHTSYL